MKDQKGILLSDFLKRDNNNLDLFRIIAASLVIVGHAYVLNPQAGQTDLIRQWTGFTYSGAFAVKLFFFISGLVVTNSLIQKNDVVAFTVSRIFRIWPALIFLCVVTALIIGPWLSALSLPDYMHERAWFYIRDNVLLKTRYDLPGVLEDVAYPNAVNGSLWTLPFEVGCYLFLIGVYLTGANKYKTLVNIIFVWIIIETLLPQRIFLYWIDSNPEFLYLPASFSAGVLMALNQDKLRISIKPALGFAILAYIVWNTRFTEFAFCCAAFFLVTYVASLKWFIRLRPKNDISYGIYLWGFLVQQTIQHFYPSPNVYLKMFASIAVSAVLGFISWHLIEKRAINLGKSVLKRISGRTEDEGAKEIKLPVTAEESLVLKETEHVNTGN